MHLIVALAVAALSHQQTPSTAVLDSLQLQVSLDRAGFSSGAIDGQLGRNTRQALEAYQSQRGDIAAALVPALVSYSITPEDVSAEYIPDIPKDLMEQSQLPALAYRNIVEALAERFHTTTTLLRRVNPSASFVAGEQIQVPNVDPLVVPVERIQPAATGTAGRRGAPPAVDKPDVVVTVSKSGSSLTVKDVDGRIVMFAPVTTGSEHDPLPIGDWKVTGVLFNPTFRYNPDLFWDADPSHSKATIAAGPNNPVGLVWIDLSKPHYGLHGSPEPEAIGHTESHGCVRLTNWDALKLAGLVKPGTRVLFTE